MVREIFIEQKVFECIYRDKSGKCFHVFLLRLWLRTDTVKHSNTIDEYAICARII